LYDLEDMKLREEILLLAVLFLILRGDERPSKEILGHDNGKGILHMIYIASR